jgi:hypothetical protein
VPLTHFGSFFIMILTLFDGAQDAIAKSEDLSFEDIDALFRDLARVPRGDAKDEKNGAIGGSFSLFRPNRRSKENVVEQHGILADIDYGLTFDECLVILKSLKCPFALWTTTNHEPETHRLRLAIPFDAPITEGFEDMFCAVGELFNNTFDLKTRDGSRMSFLPYRWFGADGYKENLYVSCLDGRPLSAAWVLANTTTRAPVRASEAVPATITAIDNVAVRDIDNSPIVKPEFISEYHSKAKGGRYYGFLCSVAMSARAQGIAISNSDLHAIGLAMNGRSSKPEHRTMREATKAFNWAASQTLDTEAAPKISYQQYKKLMKTRN